MFPHRARLRRGLVEEAVQSLVRCAATFALGRVFLKGREACEEAA